MSFQQIERGASGRSPAGGDASRQAGPHRPASSNGSRRRPDARTPDARPGRARARLFGLLPALALLAGTVGLLGPAPAAAQATPTVEFAEHGFYMLNEVAERGTGTSATVTVTITPALGQASSVKVTTLAKSTATPTADYIVGGLNPSGELDLPAGATSASFTLRAVQDHADDAKLLENVFLQLEPVASAPYAVAAHSDPMHADGMPSRARITIYDNSRSPAQQQQSNDATLSGLTATSSDSATGTYASLALTAVTGTDGYTATGRGDSVRYVKLTPTVTETGATVKVGKAGALQTVASGTASPAIEITAVETAIQVVVTAPDGNTTKTYTVTVTVTPSVEFAARNYFINEVATGQISQSATVTLNISPALSQASSITVAGVSGTTAVTPADYTLSGLTSVTTTDGGRRFTGTLTLPQGESSASFTVTAVADMVTDGVENLHLELEAISGAPYVIGLDLNEARVAILDNSLSPPNTPSVSLSVSSSTVAEGSDVTLRATLSSALTSEVVIPIKITGLNTETGDYSDLTSITIASGASYGEGTITANQDADTEDETFTVAVDTASLPAVVRGSPNLRTVTIIDDDATTQPPSGGVWSSTFDVTKKHDTLDFGCRVATGADACSTALSATTFTHGGTTYTIERIEFDSYFKKLAIALDKAWPTGLDDAKLVVGSRELTHKSYSGTRKTRSFTMDPAITLPASGTVNMKLVLAQTVTPPVQPPSGGVWSSTFDVTKKHDSLDAGCRAASGADACSTALSATTFTHGGETYTIERIEFDSYFKKLVILLDKAWPTGLDDAKLVVGSRELTHERYSGTRKTRTFTMDPAITLPSSGTVTMRLVLAQTVTPPVQPPSGGVWSSTFDVTKKHDSLDAGCRAASGADACSTALSATTFTHGGETYTIERIEFDSYFKDLIILLDKAWPTGLDDAKLQVGSRELPHERYSGTRKTRTFTMDPAITLPASGTVNMKLVLAQTVTPPVQPPSGGVWSATLTVDEYGGRAGCRTGSTTLNQCSDTSTLTDDDFVYSGTTYTVMTIQQGTDGSLTITLDAAPPAAFKRDYVLHVGSASLALSSSSHVASDTKTFRWTTPGFSWSEGQSVALSLVETTPPTAVTLSVDNANPAEGETVTVTVELDEPAPRDYTVPLVFTLAVDGVSSTASSDDITVGSQTLVIQAGERTATTTIAIVDDAVEEPEETIAISLNAATIGLLNILTPSVTSYGAGVVVTIQASDGLGLSGLTLSAGGSAVTLTPAFSETARSYTASVASSVTTLSLTPTWTGDHTVRAGSATPDQNSVFTSLIGNEITTSGSSLDVTLASSGDTAVALVFAEGNPPQPGGTVIEYAIRVSKQAGPTPPPSGGFWSATLTVDEGSSGDFGCHSADSRVATCADTNVLTDDDFTYGGKSYTIRQILRTSSALVIGFDPTVLSTDALRTSGVTFGVDGSTFAFSAGTWADNKSSVWWTSGLPTWTDGQSVSLSLSGQAVTPPTTTTTPGPATGEPHKVKVVPAGYDGGFWVYWEGNSNRDAKWNMHEVEWRLVSYGEEHGKWPSDGARRWHVMYGHNNVPVGGYAHDRNAGPSHGVHIFVSESNNGPLGADVSVEARVRNARGERAFDQLTIHEVDTAWSAEATGQTGSGEPTHVPNRPQNVKVVADGARQLTVTWDEPTWDGGAAITGYRVWHSANPGGSTLGADVRTATITGLTTSAGAAGVHYFVSVVAVNGNGEGPAGQDHAIPWDKPDAPPSVTVKSGEVHWTAAYGRGSGVTSYQVQYKNGGTWAAASQNVVTVAADSGRYDYSERKVAIAGVTASGWQARVRAFNAGGESGWTTSNSSPQMQGGAGQTQTEPGRLALPPLHASFFNLPAEHGGPTGNAVFRVRFTVPVPATPAELGAAFEVTGGKVKSVKRHSGRSDLFEVRLAPSGFGAMTVRLPVRACGTAGAICTGYGQALSQAVEATIEGPSEPALSVADARAKEGPGAKLKFAVTLDRAGAAPVTVDWATVDGTATAGEDYTAASGTLVFAPGVTKRTVRITLLDDAHDEGKETMKLRLSNPQGARIADARATGTIRNSDPLQATWLGRFGRAAAADAIAAVTARFETPRDAGSHFTLAGQRLDLARTGDGAALAEAVTGLARAFGAEEAPAAGGDPWNDPTSAPARSMSARELLMGTSFRAVLGQGAGAQLTSWGQGASVSQFSSTTPGLSLSGEAATGSLGMDYERGSLLAGFAMMHTLGEGTAHGAGRSYAMGSTVTTVLPYARFALTERVSAWGLAGTGSGALTLELDEDAAHRHRADLSMTLAAAGVRGDILTPTEAGGFALALKADAFWVRTESDAVSAPGVGNLAAARADATRLRAVLDGSRTFALAGGATLAPSVELGVRHDGGDASTGTGLELGAGLGYADPLRGLDMALRVHGLAASAEDGYREWGVSGSLKYVPGAAGRGLSMSLTPSYGADPGGSERLWMLPDAHALAAKDDAPLSSRLDAELGYGLPVFGGGFTGTPNLGFGLSDTARDYRLGWRLTSALDGDPGFELSLDATRREAGDGADHGVMLRSRINW